MKKAVPPESRSFIFRNGWTNIGNTCYHANMTRTLFPILLAACLILPGEGGNITIPKLTIGNNT